jgi:hypothetical protein
MVKTTLIERKGGLYYMGGGGSIYFSFHQKLSNLGILLQKNTNEAEMKNKSQICDSAPSYRTLFLKVIC